MDEPTPRPGLKGVFADLDDQIAFFEANQGNIPAGRPRDIFTRVLGMVKELRPRCEVRAEASVDALKAVAAAERAKVEGLRARLEAVQAAVAAAAAAAPPIPPAPAAPTAPPPPPPDPGLGARLREELLRGAGVQDAAAPAAGPGRDVWEDWN